MQDRKLVDFDTYRTQRDAGAKDNTQNVRCSEELGNAIENLIQRLRGSDPLKQAHG